MQTFLEHLNEQQRAAVEQTDGPVLVVAGAGSGKTRVITSRILHLLEKDVSPYQILAMTFTNKAAHEMRHRIAAEVGGQDSRDLTITTFHSFCARFLRREIGYLDRDTGFAIYDSQDQSATLKRVIRELNLSEKGHPADRYRHIFSRLKNSGDLHPTLEQATEQRIFAAYQDELTAQNAMDFDDLLLNTCRILDGFPECRERYQMRFRYIMVDEYQDTNNIQAKLIDLLLNEERNICVVGDEDQSIYGWRGADIRNILDFENRFPGTRVFKLEQNYRSSQRILDYANQIIAQNQLRKPKALWTEAGLGDPIVLRSEFTGNHEAEFIVQNIMTLSRKHDQPYSDFAVLFRSNYLSRVLEEMCRKYQVPYQLIGGLKFYDRKEIKDLLAYMRIVVNPRDWTSFARAVGVPPRGIGAKSLDALYRVFQQGRTLPETLAAAIEQKTVISRALKGLKTFSALYQRLIETAASHSPSAWLKALVDELDYLNLLKAADEGTADNRAANIEELLASMQELERQGVETLAQFMDFSALVNDQDDIDEDQPRVNLMTIHAAKGLEFNTVFVMGLEDGVFPNQRSVGAHEGALEEERRLFYVALTRAQRKLYLSYARRRQTYGSTHYNYKSRFLLLPPEDGDHNQTEEASLPFGSASDEPYGSTPRTTKKKMKFGELADQLEKVKGQLRDRQIEVDFQKVTGNDASKSSTRRLRAGDVVRHKTFGTGTVSSVRGKGDLSTATVYFPGRGVKTLLISKAKLEKVI